MKILFIKPTRSTGDPEPSKPEEEVTQESLEKSDSGKPGRRGDSGKPGGRGDSGRPGRADSGNLEEEVTQENLKKVII